VLRSNYGEVVTITVYLDAVTTPWYASFWSDKWVGEMPLKEKYLRLFAISNRNEASVKDMREEEGDSLNWNLG
jgi:hypothetical protein